MIHISAVVDDSVEIGEATDVWQFATVIRHAVIGKRCSVGSCAIVDGAIVGDNCAIGHGAQLHPGTKIGNDVFVGPGAIFCNDMWPSTDKAGFGLQNGSYTVIVDDGASIGAGAIILPGVRIGAGAVVAAGAVVDENVPANTVYRRNGYTSPQVPHHWRDKRMRWAV